MTDILDKIDAYVRELCEIGDDPDYSPEVNLYDEGFLDSLKAAEVMAFVENTFGITISQKDIVLYPMNTVSEFAALAERKLREK